MNCEIQVEQILLEITGVNFEKNSELKEKIDKIIVELKG